MPEELSFNQDLAFETLEELCRIGSRVVGSGNEATAAALIEGRYREYGFSKVEHLEYSFRYYDGIRARVVTPDGRHILDGIPCWMSASTPPEGLVSESIYIGTHELVANLSIKEVQDRIAFVLLADHVQTETLESWSNLYSMNPAGVVFLDIERREAPRAYAFDNAVSLFSSVPSMVVSADQAEAFHDLMFGSRINMLVTGSPKDGTMHNVCASIQGANPQTVLLCSHHDTHAFTPGATDNAAGVAIMLEVARNLARKNTRLSYRFVSFGGEELGMKGSKEFATSTDLTEIALCINFDSIGALPGVVLALSAGHDEMIEWVTNIARTNPYPARCRRAATSGGDNIVFAARGIPTIHLASYGTTSGNVSHRAIDDASLLTPRALGEVGRVACGIVETLESAERIPFSLEMPDDLQTAAQERLESGRRRP